MVVIDYVSSTQIKLSLTFSATEGLANRRLRPTFPSIDEYVHFGGVAQWYAQASVVSFCRHQTALFVNGVNENYLRTDITPCKHV